MKIAKFITFEGCEGVGKTTQISNLVTYLNSLGIEKIISTREPGGTVIAEKIRSILVEDINEKVLPITELLLIYAARYEHINKVIIPSLNKGYWVICDRYIDSTLAYQGYGHGIDIDTIIKLNNCIESILMPDITFILDMPPKDSIQRTINRNSNENRFEKMDINFHNKVREGFISISKNSAERCHLIDATNTINEINKLIANIILTTFSLDK